MVRGIANYFRLPGANAGPYVEETQDEAAGFAVVVSSIAIEFLKPGHMNDVLEIVTTPQEVRGGSISLLQQCRRGSDLVVEARVRVAFVSGGKAQRIPKSLRLAMESGRSKGGAADAAGARRQ